MGRKHLQREIEDLKKKLLTLGGTVEAAVRDATLAMETRDADLARKVLNNDYTVDIDEVHVEEDCLKILALHQPVATDLRFIVAVLKIDSDLERIGDLAVNIAERAVFLASRPPVNVSLDFIAMSDHAQLMLKKSLDALVDFSINNATQVCAMDDVIDAMNREMYIVIQDAIRADITQMEPLIHMLSASRHLERIADHATNIAEDVIYMIAGEIVRHRLEDYQP